MKTAALTKASRRRRAPSAPAPAGVLDLTAESVAAMSQADLEDATGVLFHLMQHHARHCAECCSPIIDAEGNPGYRSSACAKGAQMIEMQSTIETALLALMRSGRQGATR